MRSKSRAYRLLYKLEAGLELPMFFLAFVWLWLFIIEITHGLKPWQETLGTVIWILFIIEFIVKFAIAPVKTKFLKQSWLTAIAIFIPALRVFRLFRALTLLRSARVLSGIKFVRALTSTQRAVQEIRAAQGPAPEREMDVGIMLAHSILADKGAMKDFLKQIIDPIKEEMEGATGIKWSFHFTKPSVLNSDAPKRPTDFLEEASLRMSKGPFDFMLVITDVDLMSRQKRLEPGLVSKICNIAVVSTRQLSEASRSKRMLDIQAPEVVARGRTLILHLLGHLCGLKHEKNKAGHVMAAFAPGRLNQPAEFSQEDVEYLQERSRRLPERELHGGGIVASIIFHTLMAIRHPFTVLKALLQARAPLLPLSLPGLATAAVAPTFLLIFTAEIWDVGFSMSPNVAIFYAVLSIFGASLYLVEVQSLFLPRQEKRILTEHLAVANVVIFLNILLAMLGLFTMVMGLMLVLELFIFPADLMTTWPTLEHGDIGLGDQIRLAAFISTIGVTTGALAGGLEGRSVISRLGLFEETP